VRALLAAILLSPALLWGQSVCFVHSKLVPPLTEVSLSGANPFQYNSAQKREYPFIVPAGQELRITTAVLSVKLLRNGRASMLVLDNVIAVTAHAPVVRFEPGVVLPAGAVLTAKLINNDETEAQWMGSVVCGVLEVALY